MTMEETTSTTSNTLDEDIDNLITPRNLKQVFGGGGGGELVVEDHRFDDNNNEAPDTVKSEKSIGDVVDDDIKRMSLHTMELLDSLTDEVIEMTSDKPKKTTIKSSSSSSRKNNNGSSSSYHRRHRRERTTSPSSSTYSDDDDNNNSDNDDNNQYASAHDMALSSPEPSSQKRGMTMKTPKSGNTTSTTTTTRINNSSSNNTTTTNTRSTNNAIQHINDIDVGDDDYDSDDEDNMSYDDGSIGDDSFLCEMEKLNMVAQQLQEELSTHDQSSLDKKLIELQNSPQPTLRQRVVDINDRAIINKVLQEDLMMKTGIIKDDKTDWEKVVDKIDDIWTEQRTAILTFSVLIIWSLIIGLVYKSLYHELI